MCAAAGGWRSKKTADFSRHTPPQGSRIKHYPVETFNYLIFRPLSLNLSGSMVTATTCSPGNASANIQQRHREKHWSAPLASIDLGRTRTTLDRNNCTWQCYWEIEGIPILLSSPPDGWLDTWTVLLCCDALALQRLNRCIT